VSNEVVGLDAPECEGPFHTIPREVIAHLIPDHVPEHVVRRVVQELWRTVIELEAQAGTQSAQASLDDLSLPA
jgi:hypothetical protein